MNPARNLMANTTTKQKVVLGASALAVLFVLVFMLRLATQPSYSTIMTGLDPSETGKITSALDEKGIKYELQNNGTALAVDKSKTAEARIALASGGLPGKGQPGFELFDEQKLGSSDFQQKVTYQRALEGEIGSTIEQIDGVGGARVDLVLPEDELFEDEQSQAKAAVLLNADGASLEPGAVRGMAQLVSSAVKGLSTSNVTITDQAGMLLWPKEGAEGGVSGATTQQAVEGRYAQEMEASLNALLSQTLGPGKGRVEVRADLNVDETTRDELVYADEGVPLKQKTETEELEGGGGAAGAAGADGNIPGYGAAGAAGGSNYNRESEETDFGVNKTVTRTKVAPGEINKLNVGVMVDDSIPPADLAELETALASAAGIDERRGDELTVSQMKFAEPPAAEKPGATKNILGMAKWILLGLGTLLFLFFVTRHLRKRESEGLGEPTWLRELTAPTPLAALEQGNERFERKREENPVRMQADALAASNPERVAQQVRAWMDH